jgi:lipoyl(octanoyl) transferase
MIRYLYLSRVPYDEALGLQAELVELRVQRRIDNVLLLLEHPPVLTLGRNANRSNVLASDELLTARGVTLHEINRGGDVTYHGPGQLVGYPIFDLRSLRNPKGGRLGPVDFVRLMEEALIRLCGAYGVMAGRICGLTGVWCGLDEAHDLPEGLPHAIPKGRKVGAIGIHVSRGITSHGFAFNVTTDLRDFLLINPCRLRLESGKRNCLRLKPLLNRLRGNLGLSLGSRCWRWRAWRHCARKPRRCLRFPRKIRRCRHRRKLSGCLVQRIGLFGRETSLQLSAASFQLVCGEVGEV